MKYGGNDTFFWPCLTLRNPCKISIFFLDSSGYKLIFLIGDHYQTTLSQNTLYKTNLNTFKYGIYYPNIQLIYDFLLHYCLHNGALSSLALYVIFRIVLEEATIHTHYRKISLDINHLSSYGFLEPI